MCATMSETDIDRVNAVLGTVGTGFVINEARRFFRDNLTLFQWLPCVSETMHENSPGVKKMTMEKRQTRAYGNLCRLLMSKSWLDALQLSVITAKLTESQAYNITEAFDKKLLGTQAVMRALCALMGSSITVTHMPPVDVSAIIMADILGDAVALCGSPQDGTVTDSIQLAVSNALKGAAERLGLFQSASRPTGSLCSTFDTAFSEWHGAWKASRAISLTDVQRRTRCLNTIRDQMLAGKEVGPDQMDRLAINGSPFRLFDSSSDTLIKALHVRLATIGTAYKGMETKDLIDIPDAGSSTPQTMLKEGLLWCARAEGNRMSKAVVAASTHKDEGEISVAFGDFRNLPQWAELLQAEQGLHGHCSSSGASANLQSMSEMEDGEICSLRNALLRCKEGLIGWDSVNGDLYKKLEEEARELNDAADVIKKSAALLEWLADNLLETFRFAVIAYSRKYDLSPDNLLNLPLSDNVAPIDRLMHEARVQTFAADKAVLPPLSNPNAIPSYSSPNVRPKLTKSLMGKHTGQTGPSTAADTVGLTAAAAALGHMDIGLDAGTTSPPPASSSNKTASDSDGAGSAGGSSNEDAPPSPAELTSDSGPEDNDITPAAEVPGSSSEELVPEGTNWVRRSVRPTRPPDKLMR